MTQDEMKKRTKMFAMQIIDLCREIPKTEEGALIRRQIFRSGTSVGANYRAACRGRSKADFISKLGIVFEEADETLFWLEILTEKEIANSPLLTSLSKEANELIAIFVASLNTAKDNPRS